VEILSFSVRSLTGVAFLGVLGTTVDFFDFFISGTAAALAWPTVFFAGATPALALVFSYTAFVISYFARPVGGFVFGHLADTTGRRQALLWTLTTMGFGTLGIGLLPSFQSVGNVAIVLLILFRILQGFGIGGEWGGAASWVTEFAAKSKWRSFWGSWVQQGSAFGILLSGLVFTILLSSLSSSAFLSWGWRVPFYIGAVIILVAVVIRYFAFESPLFRRIKETNTTERLPSVRVLRERWTRILPLGAIIAFSAQVGALGVFAQSYIKALGLSAAFAASTLTLGGLVSVVGILLSGILGEKLGRRRIILVALVGGLLFTFPYFLLMNTKNLNLILLGTGITFFFGSLEGGIIGSFFPEQFSTKYRASGAGISFQLAGVITAAAPVLTSYFLGVYGGPLVAWPYIAAVSASYAVIAMVGLAFTRETKGVDMERIDM
jgi:MHS family shikimate/dehydroshikimate transporter-like MFS transporter